MSSGSPRVVYGLVVASAMPSRTPHEGEAEREPVETDLGKAIDPLLSWLSKAGELEVERYDAPSYEALADGVREGKVDIAWLPPIVYARLGEAASPLGSIVRGGSEASEAALVIREDSTIRTIDALQGARAGWVDPWSAAGFVLPRVKLALSGVDPRTLFRTETFHGSHHAAIRALVDGSSDVAGTYARKDADGKVTAGAWTEVDGVDASKVRVLATFGAIPPDVIGARADLAADLKDRMTRALLSACGDDDGKKLLHALFGGDEIREGPPPGYDALRDALDVASSRGLFD